MHYCISGVYMTCRKKHVEIHLDIQSHRKLKVRFKLCQTKYIMIINAELCTLVIIKVHSTVKNST